MSNIKESDCEATAKRVAYWIPDFSIYSGGIGIINNWKISGRSIKIDISTFWTEFGNVIITDNENIDRALSESFDGVIQFDSLDNFKFDDVSISELAPLLEENVTGVSGPKLVYSQPSSNVYDLANIGTTSDDISNEK